ncbi:helicase-related protein [Cohnella rhizosphaerae]|uniref:helicase-related protein n=1 Tax=Cohnella rhizosphaerae TaxID=1457232 RepID=UPI003B8A6D72
MYPVETVYLDRRSDAPVERLAAETTARALARHDGDALVFLPGYAEIRRTAASLSALLGSAGAQGVEIAALHGSMPPGEQDRALAPAANGRRKVVLATPVAESSLTVEGVRIVVDGGADASATLFAANRHVASRDGSHSSVFGRSAPRARGPRGAGRLLPAVDGGRASAIGAGRDARDPGSGSRAAGTRAGRVGRIRSGGAGLAGRAAGRGLHAGAGAAGRAGRHRRRRRPDAARLGHGPLRRAPAARAYDAAGAAARPRGRCLPGRRAARRPRSDAGRRRGPVAETCRAGGERRPHRGGPKGSPAGGGAPVRSAA